MVEGYKGQSLRISTEMRNKIKSALIEMLEGIKEMNQDTIIKKLERQDLYIGSSKQTKKRILRSIREEINDAYDYYRTIIGQGNDGYFICRTDEDIDYHCKRMEIPAARLKERATRDRNAFKYLSKQGLLPFLEDTVAQGKGSSEGLFIMEGINIPQKSNKPSKNNI